MEERTGDASLFQFSGVLSLWHHHSPHSSSIIQVDSIVPPPLLLGRILGNLQLGLGFILYKPFALHYC